MECDAVVVDLLIIFGGFAYLGAALFCGYEITMAVKEDGEMSMAGEMQPAKVSLLIIVAAVAWPVMVLLMCQQRANGDQGNSGT